METDAQVAGAESGAVVGFDAQSQEEEMRDDGKIKIIKILIIF